MLFSLASPRAPLAHIWQVSYRAGRIGLSESIESVRGRHQLFQIVGVVVVLGGGAAIMMHKCEIGHTIVPTSYHATAGTVVLALLLGQSLVGVLKLRRLKLNGAKTSFIRIASSRKKTKCLTSCTLH